MRQITAGATGMPGCSLSVAGPALKNSKARCPSQPGAAAEGRLPGGPGLRTVSLGPDFSPMMELVTGTFARRGERTAFGASHPLNLLWQAFADEVASGDPYSL
jgi:hypothetical protein